MVMGIDDGQLSRLVVVVVDTAMRIGDKFSKPQPPATYLSCPQQLWVKPTVSPAVCSLVVLSHGSQF